MSDDGRAPELVREAAVSGGLARCDCGYSVRFAGNESMEEAREQWQTDEHRRMHFGPSDTDTERSGGQP